MTECEWLRWTRPTALLKCLGVRASRRQYALFACACYRRIWDLLAVPVRQRVPGLWGAIDTTEQRAVEVVERFCLDQADPVELETPLQGSGRHLQQLFDSQIPLFRPTDDVAQNARWLACGERMKEPIPIPMPCSSHRFQTALEADDAEKKVQADLLRCIVGNPYRPSQVDPTWLAWNGGLVVRLAEQIHSERRFDEMPVLGDALEDAGCSDAAILQHCRQNCHALGCWVLDLLRAKFRCRLFFGKPERDRTSPPVRFEMRNVTPEAVSLVVGSAPGYILEDLIADADGSLVAHHGYINQAPTPPGWSHTFAPGERLEKQLRSLERATLPAGDLLAPGNYTMQVRYRHNAIDLVSAPLAFRVQLASARGPRVVPVEAI